MFIQSLKARPAAIRGGGAISFLTVSKEMMTLLKALACVMVLIGHYAARDLSSGIATKVDKLIYMTVANIALVLFMFFSGYGLSVKDYKRVRLLNEWGGRFLKIYLPLLFIGIIYVTICYFLPDTFSMDIVKNRELPILVHEYNNWTDRSIEVFRRGLFGYSDWYVMCILYFYTIFYITQWISQKTMINISIVLSVLMLLYTIFAYFYYSWPEAHFFRYPCAFMLGHFIAKHNHQACSKKERLTDAALILIFIASMLIHSPWFWLNYILAFVIIFLSNIISRHFDVKTCSLLYSLGTISYFYYLSHGRICYPLMFYVGIDDMFVWAIITAIVSYILWKCYGLLKSIID